MTQRKKTRSHLTKHIIGGTITLLCLFVIAKQVDFAEAFDVLKNFQWSLLVLAIISLAFGYSLRIFRWSIMLSATGSSTPWRNCVAPFLGSIALNNVLPFRIGDIVRALIFPASMGITKTTATSSLLMERLIDLLTLLGCFAVGIMIVQKASIPAVIIESTTFLAIVGGVALLMIFLFSGSLARLFHRLAHIDNDNTKPRKQGKVSELYILVSKLLNSFQVMSKPRVLFSVTSISMMVWIGESGLFYFLLLGFGFDSNPALAIVVMSISTLSTLVPSSPGYVGPFHLAAFTAVSMLGGTSAQAGSFAILAHLTLWLPTTIAGAIAILMRPELFQAIRSKPITELESISNNI